jgi:hypothetical protein
MTLRSDVRIDTSKSLEIRSETCTEADAHPQGCVVETVHIIVRRPVGEREG